MRCLSILLLILLACPSAQAGPRLKFGYIDQPLSYTSLAVLKAAYAKLGYTVDTAKGPAARLLADSDAGLTDGEVHRIEAIAAQHPNLIRVETQLNTVEGVLISCGKTYDITSVNDLIKYRVAVRIGNKYAENLTKNLPNVIRTPDADKMMQLLLNNRVDLILSDRPWALSQKKLPGRECVHILEPPLVTIPLYHYLHVRNKKLVPIITRILQEMRESGEAEAIRQKAFKQYLRRLQ